MTGAGRVGLAPDGVCACWLPDCDAEPGVGDLARLTEECGERASEYRVRDDAARSRLALEILVEVPGFFRVSCCEVC